MSFTQEEVAQRHRLFVCWDERIWKDTQVPCVICGKISDICCLKSYKPSVDSKAYPLCNGCYYDQCERSPQERGMEDGKWLEQAQSRCKLNHHPLNNLEKAQFDVKVACHVCSEKGRLGDMMVMRLTESKEPDAILLECPKCPNWIEENREPLDLIMADNKCSQHEAIRMWKVENSVVFTWTAG